MNIAKKIAEELEIKVTQVEAAVKTRGQPTV